MSLVFVNNSSETFTPTASGAIATFIWECCRVGGSGSGANGRETAQPWVITRRCPDQPYPYANTIFLDYPTMSENRLKTFIWRAERKLGGWRHLRQGAYARRVADALRDGTSAGGNLAARPLVLHNDPEMAIFLRDSFPNATIVHHFHNQLDCKPKFRARFAGAGLIVTAVSNFTARWVEQYYNLPKDSAHAIYNGVDAERFRPGAAEAAHRCTLNFVGRTGREKGPDLLLRAAGRLAEKRQDFDVQIIGSNHWNRFELDDYQRELNSLADDLRQRGVQVHCLGHVERASMPQKIRAAHIHVVPSRWDEPFGLTTLEGMACGLATVGSRTGGTPEIIGESGFLFARDSADSLAEQLAPLVDDVALRRRYAAKARSRAEEFTWERTWSSLRVVAGA